MAWLFESQFKFYAPKEIPQARGPFSLLRQ
jgi:hypothetical protein